MERDTPHEKKAYIFITNMGFHWQPDEPKASHAIMAYGFHITDFSKPGYFRLSDIYRMKKKHVDANEIMEAFQKYPAIPDTFDGQLPSIAYDREDKPPVIGERYAFEDGKGGEMEATVTTAMVNEHDKKMWIGLDNGHIMTKDISDRLLNDYKKHPDTFFGVLHEPGKSFEKEDEYGFFERMVQIHLAYDKENLLQRMKNWPDQKALSELPHEELVLAYCEGLIVQIKQMRAKREETTG